MSQQVFTHVSELKGFSVKNCPSMPTPGAFLMCTPDHFDVVDVKNPFMASSVGTVNKSQARAQWEAVRRAFEDAGKPVRVLEGVSGLEDMVFCANQTLSAVTARMERLCVPSHMRHPSRRREVPHVEAWFRGQGYSVRRLSDATAAFEGMGDCRWHPGKRLLWGGYGFRTDPEVYEEIAAAFGSPVVRLKLVNERFYHLNTCFCPLNQDSVLIYPPAFAADSLELILKLFPVVLAADAREAAQLLACNCAIVDSRVAIIQKGCSGAQRHLRAVGLDVIEVETSEFIKSGGSVTCISMPVY